ncbi:MAG TPA: IPT/TIG domain-containing protein [Jatrophihabitans sp.]|nr:IPT/TIG domain-containing protein [Jatrophihabitans sp.]
MLAVSALVAGSAVSISIAPTAASAATRGDVLKAAAEYARSKGYHIGIAVLDTHTGATYGAGDYGGVFASESVVKAFIATRLLYRGQMYGNTARMASKMIRQSDDAMATALYGRVGGDGLIGWVKRQFNLPGLGYRPSRPGWWGNTHITPMGLVRFYAKVRTAPRIGPWLINEMHHATRYGSDGTYQFFGIPSATSGFGVKQGWGDDYDDGAHSADFNTTGFVNGDRYTVAILARGPIRYYGSAISSMLTHTARLLLPGGHFPDPVPTVNGLSRNSGATHGGGHLTVRGTDFTSVTGVYFGGVRAAAYKVLSPRRLDVTVPQHEPGWVDVRITTTHGGTAAVKADRFEYVLPPAVSAISPPDGSTAGGETVTVTGSMFRSVTQVSFGGTAATSVKVISPTSLTAVAPAHAAGQVDVVVTTAYGRSAVNPNDQYTYTPPPGSGEQHVRGGRVPASPGARAAPPRRPSA